MKKIPFVKYTSFGNNFVILDELGGQLFSEYEWPAVANHVTSPYFGVGCDNLLVLQRATRRKLDEINEARGYWAAMPDPGDSQMIFRMFEPDGTEAFSCGNGLMCIAEYLRSQRATLETQILTEVPLGSPQAVRIGSVPRLHRSFVTLGSPRRLPEDMVDTARLERLADGVDRIDGLVIELREHDLRPFADACELRVNAYLAFTGEPHLVMFPETDGDVDPHDVAGTFFSSTVPHYTDTTGLTRRVNFGTTVLRRIGYYLNHRAADLFPLGINVNVARVDAEGGYIEYRCFERGINRETLACGTGALAVTHIVAELGMLAGDSFEVRPHRSRWYQPDAVIGVTRRTTGGWTLDAAPRLVCDGAFIAKADPLADGPDDEYEAARSEAESVDGGEESAPRNQEAAA